MSEKNGNPAREMIGWDLRERPDLPNNAMDEVLGLWSSEISGIPGLALPLEIKSKDEEAISFIVLIPFTGKEV